MRRKAWRIRAAGKVFTMIDPAGCTREEALLEARARWANAEILDH